MRPRPNGEVGVILHVSQDLRAMLTAASEIPGQSYRTTIMDCVRAMPPGLEAPARALNSSRVFVEFRPADLSEISRRMVRHGFTNRSAFLRAALAWGLASPVSLA